SITPPPAPAAAAGYIQRQTTSGAQPLDPRYDIYLSGKLAEGTTPAAAAASLARLFRATPEAMAALITGRPQLLKRNVDRATAARYRDALQQAGVMVAFRQLEVP